MIPTLDPKLDSFERRLHELEVELDELRALAENGSATETADTPVVTIAAAPVESEPLPGDLPRWARERLERGDYRVLFKDLERARRNAVSTGDLEALVMLQRVALLAQERAPIGVDARAAELARAIRQNIRFVERKSVAEQAVRPRVEGPSADRRQTRPRIPAAAWEPLPAAPVRTPPPPRPPLIRLPEFSSGDLFGAKALAITGGIVTLLGIVFFFVLAVNRGWIGPEARIALGGIAAAIVYGAGLELRRRYGETHAALAAVAAGIAGGYMVLLAAAQLYDLVGNAAALVIAAAIAALAVATALRWHSQMIAGLGLLGAMLAPVAVAAQDGLSATGVGFAALMAVATAIVAIRERWDVLLVAGAAASLSQAFAFALQSEYRGASPSDVVAISAIFASITVGTGIARQLRGRSRELLPLPTSFLLVGASFAVACALRLYGTPESRGFALLAVAVAFGAVAAPFVRRPHDRDLSALLGALGLVVGGIAFGGLMSGSPLAFAWAGESAVLAWLALRIRDIRYQLFALVYFAAAVIHVLAIDMTPAHLFKPLEISAGGALAVVAVGAAAALIGLQTSSRTIPFAQRRGIFAPLSPILWYLGDRQRELRIAGWAISVLAAVYALSLGILAAFSSFDWGHVAMYTFWSALGLGVYVFGFRSRRALFTGIGLAWLVLTNVAAIANGQAELGSSARAAACLVAGVSLLLATLTELFAVIAPRYRSLSADARLLWLGSAWGCAVMAVAALSVGIVSAIPSYDWGRVAMSSTWSALGLGVALAAFRRRAGEIRTGAVVGLVITDIAAIWVGVSFLGRDARATACLIAGLALLTATLVELFLVIAPGYAKLSAEQRAGRLTFAWTAAGTSVAALSVGVVAAIPSYDWGRASMFVLWSALGLGVLVAALRRGAPAIAAGGITALGITVAVSFVVGERFLEATPRGITYVVVGAAVLLGALADQLMPRRTALGPVAFGFTLASVGMGLAAVITLVAGSVGDADERGLAIFVLAGLYGTLAVLVFGIRGQRDFSTLLWGTALVLGYGASERLLPGTWHVLVLALSAAVLAWLSRTSREPRFLAAGAGALLVGAATVVFGTAPPSHLFTAVAHPGQGALGALLVAAAAVVVGRVSGEQNELRRRFRLVCYWAAGVLTVYGLSLFILASFQWAFSGSVDTNFHRGHTAVSAFCGLIGLALLYVGLTRYRALRVAGFVMFGVSLAKIFLFDLPSLNSVTRALSFLAVGAVLLLGGFFYQRLATAQPAQRRRARRPVTWPGGLGRADLLMALGAAAVLVVWFGSGIAPLGGV
jgi:uncharacterized membrane protein